METPVARGKDLHRVGRIAMVIGLAFVIGGVGVGPALAGGGGHDHGDNGERHQAPRHEEHHDHYRHAPPPNYYYVRNRRTTTTLRRRRFTISRRRFTTARLPDRKAGPLSFREFEVGQRIQTSD